MNKQSINLLKRVASGPWTSLIFLALSLPSPANAGKPGGGQPGPTPVCIEFRDQAGDKAQSDGFGAYCHDGAASIAADIPNDGPLELNTNTNQKKPSNGRTLFLDFSDFVLFDNDTTAMPPTLPDARLGTVDTDPWSGYPDRVYLSTRHWRNEANVNVYLPVFDVPKGQSRAHGLYLNLWVGNQKWVLTYGNIEFQTDPYSTLVVITRLTDRAQGDACNSWLIEAPSVATTAVDSTGITRTVHDIAKLKKADFKGNLWGQPSSGHFHMPFSMIVTDDLTNQCP